MSGANNIYTIRQKEIRKHLKRNNPLAAKKMPYFDMRGYAHYIANHHLSATEITDDILSMFMSDSKDTSC